MTAGPRILLTAAALVAAACFGLYVLAYDWHTGGHVDGVALLGFTVIRVSILTHAAHFLQSAGQPLPYLVICTVLVLIVLAARGLLVAGAVIGLLAAANATTKLLKPIIASASGVHVGPVAAVGVGSFPSGHSTAAMAFACAIVIAAPPMLRPVGELVGGLIVLAVSWSVVVLSSHLPSDVMGGYLVSTFWGLITLAALWAAPARWRGSGRRWPRHGVAAPLSLTTATATLVTVGGVAVILAIIRLRPDATHTSSLIDFGLVAVAMTLLLSLLIGGVAALAGVWPDAARPAERRDLAGDGFGDR